MIAQEDDEMLDHIASLIGDNRFQMYQRYLDKEVSDRKNMMVNAKDWESFREERGIIKGIMVARDLLPKRIDARNKRIEEEKENG